MSFPYTAFVEAGAFVTVVGFGSPPFVRARFAVADGARLRVDGRWLAGLMFLLLAMMVVGCGGSGGGDPLAPVTGGGGAAALTAANSLYVVQPGDAIFLPATPAYLLQYPKSATGTPNPATSITSQSQILFTGVAMDAAGQLYVSAVSASEVNTTTILVYQVGGTGAVTPKATYSTPEPGLSTFNVGQDGKVYLTSGGTIWVTQGGVTLRTIKSPTSAATAVDALFDAKGIAADAAGDVYVVNGDALDFGANPVLVYSAATAGTALPTGVIEGDKTGFTKVSAVAVDRAGNIYVGTPTAILVFAAGTMGNVPPVRTITGPATMLAGVGDLKVDSGGVVYVLTGGLVGGQSVLGFAAGADGNVAPITVLGPQVLKENVKQSFGGIAVM